MGFPRRLGLPELMEAPDVDPGEQHAALRALALLNRVGGTRRRLTRRHGWGRVLDVGTGGADLPESLLGTAGVRLAVGVDNHPTTLRQAATLSPHVRLVRADALRLPFGDGSFDTAMCHLFLHHLDEDRAVAALAEMGRVARRVVAIDLARSRWMLAAVWVLTRLTRSRLARNDGPVSVRRAYTAREARDLAERAGLRARVLWAGPGRWGLELDRDPGLARGSGSTAASP
jgi:SAM-dependent methyltransferase